MTKYETKFLLGDFIIAFLVWLPVEAIAPQFEYPEIQERIIIQGNSFIGISPPTPLIWHSFGVLSGVDLEHFIKETAEKNNLDAFRFRRLLNCECNFAIPNEECIGDEGKARGRAQFWRTTFEKYCEGNYYSEKDQIKCAGKMISEGKKYHWTCEY